MNKKKIVEIILLILIITSIIVQIVYLSEDNTLLDTVGYDKVKEKGEKTDGHYYRYLLETYKFLKTNFITCIVSLLFFIILLIIKLSEIKVDKILNFILTLIIVLFLVLFTGLAFVFLFYLLQPVFYLEKTNLGDEYRDRLKYFDMEINLDKLRRLIKEQKNNIKSLEEQADKLEYLINLYYILVYSSFFTAGFLALMILNKLY